MRWGGLVVIVPASSSARPWFGSRRVASPQGGLNGGRSLYENCKVSGGRNDCAPSRMYANSPICQSSIWIMERDTLLTKWEKNNFKHASFVSASDHTVLPEKKLLGASSSCRYLFSQPCLSHNQYFFFTKGPVLLWILTSIFRTKIMYNNLKWAMHSVTQQNFSNFDINIYSTYTVQLHMHGFMEWPGHRTS